MNVFLLFDQMSDLRSDDITDIQITVDRSSDCSYHRQIQHRLSPYSPTYQKSTLLQNLRNDFVDLVHRQINEQECLESRKRLQ